jgi:hypothetical protein
MLFISQPHRLRQYLFPLDSKWERINQEGAAGKKGEKEVGR